MAEGATEAPAESGGGGDSGAGALERGVAPIKPQYLTTKERFHEFLEAKGQEKPSRETEAGDPGGNDLGEPEAKRIRLEDGQTGDGRTEDGQTEDGRTEDGRTEEAAEPGEQPQAQKRARGQNKGRPHVKPTHYDKDRLCPSLVQEPATQCAFGARCRFLHDVGRYLAAKPADLGPRCVLFETFGRCPAGVTCRFAGAHLGPGGRNLVRQEQGVQERTPLAHRLLPELRTWGAALVTVGLGAAGGGDAPMAPSHGVSPPAPPPSLCPPARLSVCPSLCLSARLPPSLTSAPGPQLHGRSREQRYTKLADWRYIEQCVAAASPMPLFGNGDILSYEDANRAMQTGVAGVMIARGALLKPWLFTEIKEQRHWDISASERLDILRDFTHYGLEHWGSDTQGVERTRRFLLEWLSFLCRYVPVGLLERLPQRLNERPPYFLGRDYLETLLASQRAADWIRISEMLLGPVPRDFVFLPKHKANAYK
uniref:tRNA-dihydrouridine(47) synthase [NAD(P)(+)] n=1 Tax=Equus caballus TaxID=9796 RepID=A0A9L0RYD9_HORSE